MVYLKDPYLLRPLMYTHVVCATCTNFIGLLYWGDIENSGAFTKWLYSGKMTKELTFVSFQMNFKYKGFLSDGWIYTRYFWCTVHNVAVIALQDSNGSNWTWK